MLIFSTFAIFYHSKLFHPIVSLGPLVGCAVLLGPLASHSTWTLRQRCEIISEWAFFLFSYVFTKYFIINCSHESRTCYYIRFFFNILWKRKRINVGILLQKIFHLICGLLQASLSHFLAHFYLLSHIQITTISLICTWWGG